jgi:hypothetical protein
MVFAARWWTAVVLLRCAVTATTNLPYRRRRLSPPRGAGWEPANTFCPGVFAELKASRAGRRRGRRRELPGAGASLQAVRGSGGSLPRESKGWVFLHETTLVLYTKFFNSRTFFVTGSPNPDPQIDSLNLIFRHQAWNYPVPSFSWQFHQIQPILLPRPDVMLLGKMWLTYSFPPLDIASRLRIGRP